MSMRMDKALAAELLNSPLQFVLLDIDGVVSSGNDILPRIPETLKYLRFRGKAIRFISNNSSHSRRAIHEVFQAHGIRGVAAGEILNSAYAVALRLRQLLGGPDGLVRGNLFVIGEDGLHEELREVLAPGFISYGLELHDPERVGGLDPAALRGAWTTPVLPPPQQPLRLLRSNPGPGMGRENRRKRKDDSGKEEDDSGEVVQAGSANERWISLAELNAVAVVVGLDFHFSSLKLTYAAIILRGRPSPSKDNTCEETEEEEEEEAEENPRALFIATNEDPQVPIGLRTVFVPGDGCLVRAVATAAGREPDAVCGKPQIDLAMALFANEDIHDVRTSCLMVGDRLTTDVAFGNAMGCQTMLVLSGAEGLRDVEKAKREQRKDLIPDYIADSLACFIP
ncbi:unnamed protein product [Phytomonas sp. Hart1]|nr:unnamed protein product [Phytomonas sp. Hart1]|eukprot:CCW71989.1 unnamed protein product [Phytomonas sp. isolate Hart1]